MHRMTPLYGVLVVLVCMIWSGSIMNVNGQRLFISQYVGGSAPQYRAIEIFNPTCSTIALSEYRIQFAVGGGAFTATNQIVLSSITANIAPQGVITICGTIAEFGSACTGSLATASLGSEMTSTNAVGLFHNYVLIDIIGGFGEYFDTTWSVAGVSGASSGYSWIRQPTVSEGTTEFRYPGGVNNNDASTSQWIVTSYTSGALATLGSHTIDTTLPVFICPSNLYRLTCGTTGSSSYFGSPAVGAAFEVECPTTCLTSYVFTAITDVVGVSPYSRSSRVCRAAIHYGALPLDLSNMPSGLSQAEKTAFCATGRVPVLSPHSALAVGNRARGRPHLSLVMSAFQAYTTGQTDCILGAAAAAATGFYIKVSNSTSCPSSCSGHGECDVANGICKCYQGYTGNICSIRTCPTCSNGGTCNTGTGVCDCTSTRYTGDQCNQLTCTSLSNCNPPHGTCDSTSGTCTCSYPYYGVDCSLVTCPTNCHDQGRCDSTGTCHCYTGFFGADCALKQCPGGCENAGVCDYTSGECTCDSTSYDNGACRTGACPNDCSGNGSCDYHTRICSCNNGYIGYDCATAVHSLS